MIKVERKEIDVPVTKMEKQKVVCFELDEQSALILRRFLGNDTRAIARDVLSLGNNIPPTTTDKVLDEIYWALQNTGL